MEKSDFQLGDMDAAIIFKQDMTTELILPNMSSEDVIDQKENPNLFLVLAISASLQDEEFSKLIYENLNKQMSEAVIVPRCTCGPEDCSCEDC